MKYLFDKFANNTNRNSQSSKLRKKRFEQFIKLLSVTGEDKILDVGGNQATWFGSGLEQNVTLFNLRFDSREGPFSYIEGDACDMTIFPEKYFDIVFSNSVIEHLGSDLNKIKFAKEIIRVAKRYWIQTPNKHFPIEPHFVFPLFQYFPYSLQKFIGLKWEYSHLKRNNENILDELYRLKLLTKSELKRLFQNATILEEKYFGITKSLIAYQK